MRENFFTVLTIAGSDPSGGAGVQADLRAFQALGVQGVSAITALTAQNERCFFSLNPVSSLILREQLQAIIAIHKIDAVKIGMLGTEENVFAVHRFLENARVGKVVLDPVFKSTTGGTLLESKGIELLKKNLIASATIVTPNLEEAEIITKMKIRSVDAMKEAALKIHTTYRGVQAVLIKGGHLHGEATDVLYEGRDWTLFKARKKFPRDVHGTGCVLSAAIAAHLAMGQNLKTAVEKSKALVTRTILSFQLQ